MDRRFASSETANSMRKDDWEDSGYSQEFVKKICELERLSHGQENPEQLAMNALKAATEFYDADWCGVVEADLIFHVWDPVWWTSGKTHNDLVRKFFEQGKITIKEDWLNALHNGKEIIIEDVSVYKNTNPAEYEEYEKMDIHSVIAYPFWQNPSGFLIVLNPRKHKNKVSFIRALVYVMYCSLVFVKHMSGKKKSFTIHEIKNKKDVVINLFGSLEVHTLNGVLKEEEINSPKIIRILTYLLLHPNQNYPARRLCDEIWSDEIIDNPSGKIKSLVYRLHNTFHHVLEDRLIICTKRGYQMNPELNIVTDLQLFEDYWLLSQRALSSKAKIETLKKIIEIYKGSLLSSAAGEHWILHSERDFHHRYIGIINELLKTFYEDKNYLDIQEYASKALGIDNANKELYFWLITSMYKMGSNAMARGELRNAEKILLEDEYQELVLAVKKTNFAHNTAM